MLAWTWLGTRMVARFYLAFVMALATFALAPLLFGMTGSAVVGGSMRPHLQAGDVVLSHTLPKDAPTPMGRVVTFLASPEGKSTALIVHRVVGTNDDGSLITAGDANAMVDSAALNRTDIIGQAYFLIPWVGLPLLWFTGGEFVPFAIWGVITVLALVVEGVGSGSAAPRAPSLPAHPVREGGSRRRRRRQPVLVG
ncbi:MAG: signal peptidase I [Actinomycetota bacterium]|nr:signal peptidase I [Actinomycetota bacterium]